MAKFYGKRDNYLLEKDAKYYLYSAGLVILPLLIIWLAYTFGGKTVPSVWLLVVAVVLIVLVLEVADPLIKHFRIESAKYYSGFSGENDIKTELTKLPDEFTVFQNLMLGNNKGNLDFVVTGPPGMFILEVKSHKGHIGYNGLELTVNGRSFTDKDFFRQMHGETWALKNYLSQQLGVNVFLHQVLVFSNPYAEVNFGREQINNVFVIKKDNLLNLLSSLPAFNYPADRIKIEQALLKATVT